MGTLVSTRAFRSVLVLRDAHRGARWRCVWFFGRYWYYGNDFGVRSAEYRRSCRSVLPTTGLPLPFVSYGGSSLIGNMAGVGILLGVARMAPKHQEGLVHWQR